MLPAPLEIPATGLTDAAIAKQETSLAFLWSAPFTALQLTPVDPSKYFPTRPRVATLKPAEAGAPRRIVPAFLKMPATGLTNDAIAKQETPPAFLGSAPFTALQLTPADPSQYFPTRSRMATLKPAEAGAPRRIVPAFLKIPATGLTNDAIAKRETSLAFLWSAPFTALQLTPVDPSKYFPTRPRMAALKPAEAGAPRRIVPAFLENTRHWIDGCRNCKAGNVAGISLERAVYGASTHARRSAQIFSNAPAGGHVEAG